MKQFINKAVDHHQSLHLGFTWSLQLLLRKGTFIQLATSDTNPWCCCTTADGKWHPAANPPISSAFPRPPWNASPRIPPVCLWRASRQADGASRHHCRGQGGGQVCHGCFWLWLVRNQLGCYPICSLSLCCLQIWEAWRAAGEEFSSRQNAVHSACSDAGAEASTQGKCL